MAKTTQDPKQQIPDAAALAKAYVEIGEKSQRIVAEFLRRQPQLEDLTVGDPLAIGRAFVDISQRLLADPAAMVKTQTAFWQETLLLWQKSNAVFWGLPDTSAPSDEQSSTDRRFQHQDWQHNPFFDYIKQSYLLVSQWLQNTVAGVDGLDAHSKQKLAFYTRQFADAIAPTNFALTNPEVLRATVESGGKNLIDGLHNLLNDLERSQGRFNIRQSDEAAFALGDTIASSAGAVVFQNDLMQLIQYNPSTTRVFKKPLLIVPPWINKFYILDLTPANSLVKYLVEQGFSVFIISWVNPDSRLAQKQFDDYMLEGPIAALDAIEQATGERDVNALGYCLGGTLLAATSAYLAAKRVRRIKSCTYLATMLDFEQPGELAVFIDEEQLDALEKRMDQRGYLAADEMATTFNLLRANDLIWSFFVNNYLLGKDPFPFDLLYWNSDSTRMPAAMHSFYLRTMYQNNLLKEPGAINLAGKAIDLSKISSPSFIVAAQDDHIAPWRSVFAGTQLFSGPSEFLLAGSGHIAGIINPPAKEKYYYWHNTNPVVPSDDVQWFEHSEQQSGSWWSYWLNWLQAQAGKKVAARQVGAGDLAIIEPAPGSYVTVRAN